MCLIVNFDLESCFVFILIINDESKFLEEIVEKLLIFIKIY